MENFRDHERDFKQKGYKLKTLLPEGFFSDQVPDDER